MPHRRLWFVVPALLCGCTGVVGSYVEDPAPGTGEQAGAAGQTGSNGGPVSGSPSKPPEGGAANATRSGMKRLTQSELRNTLRDLYGWAICYASPSPGSYALELEALKSWLRDRLTGVDANMATLPGTCE